MSDRVSTIAIEDVLSSIRRLVSVGDTPPGPETGLRVAAPPALTDRLVLTPALRVGPVDDPMPLPVPPQPGSRPTDNTPADILHADILPRAANIATMPLPRRTGPGIARSALEQRIAELEAAVTLQPDDWEPDGSEEVPVVDWTAARSATLISTLTAPTAAPAAVLSVLPVDPLTGAAGWSAAVAPPDDTFAPSPMTLTEEPVFASRATAPRIATDVLDLGKAATRITLLEVTGPPAPDAPPQALLLPGDGPDLADHPAHDPAPDLGHDLIDDLIDDLTDDFGDDFDLSDAAGPGRTTSGFSPLPGDGPAMPDEDLLRDLVAQVVQQALQGELGERITRNVRKMVRREIYRVLASQDLE